MSTEEITPIIGQDIYIPTVGFVFRGADDVHGGLARVIAIQHGRSAGKPCVFVQTECRPKTWVNWSQSLAEMQDELREKFGEARAYLDPDYHPSVNDDGEGWK